MIPKIIHYCWLSKDPIPVELQACMSTWRRKLPDYEFMLWNFDRFDINSSLWVKQAFEAKMYAFACDYIRIYALYNYGGIYLDMDVEVVKSFDNLLNEKYILGMENPYGIEAAVMGAEPYSELFSNALAHYENRSFIKSDGSFDMYTCPRVIMDRIRILDSNTSQQESIYAHLKFFDFFTGVNYPWVRELFVTSNTYTIHYCVASWCPPSPGLVDRLKVGLGVFIEHFLIYMKRFIEINRIRKKYKYYVTSVESLKSRRLDSLVCEFQKLL